MKLILLGPRGGEGTGPASVAKHGIAALDRRYVARGDRPARRSACGRGHGVASIEIVVSIVADRIKGRTRVGLHPRRLPAHGATGSRADRILRRGSEVGAVIEPKVDAILYRRSQPRPGGARGEPLRDDDDRKAKRRSSITSRPPPRRLLPLAGHAKDGRRHGQRTDVSKAIDQALAGRGGRARGPVKWRALPRQVPAAKAKAANPTVKAAKPKAARAKPAPKAPRRRNEITGKAKSGRRLTKRR
jgi:hypothetical protein